MRYSQCANTAVLALVDFLPIIVAVNGAKLKVPGTDHAEAGGATCRDPLFKMTRSPINQSIL